MHFWSIPRVLHASAILSFVIFQVEVFCVVVGCQRFRGPRRRQHGPLDAEDPDLKYYHRKSLETCRSWLDQFNVCSRIHRFVFYIKIGLCILHTCKNKLCVEKKLYFFTKCLIARRNERNLTGGFFYNALKDKHITECNSFNASPVPDKRHQLVNWLSKFNNIEALSKVKGLDIALDRITWTLIVNSMKPVGFLHYKNNFLINILLIQWLHAL